MESAALGNARATFRNSGQREATPTSAPEGGQISGGEAGADRTCRVMSSVPAGSNRRAVASRFGKTTGIPPTGAMGQSAARKTLPGR
jgi:hypothetical protein